MFKLMKCKVEITGLLVVAVDFSNLLFDWVGVFGSIFEWKVSLNGKDTAQ